MRALDLCECSASWPGHFSHGERAPVPIEEEAAWPQKQSGCFGAETNLHRLFSPLPSHYTDYSTLAPSSMVTWRIIIIIHPPYIAGTYECHCCHLCLMSCYYQYPQVFLQVHHFLTCLKYHCASNLPCNDRLCSHTLILTHLHSRIMYLSYTHT